ncbi:putative ubx domain-containing protein [Phaeomoniella chlamydospora]|uniref:Putative ubx domain-containing protein n=1 Tax=Phaeomoniella chlamydospora TaxID=158046 RepID=A0A0G2G113_PHACM|nr:putative ubx domain-containing protein [Phaeomoniella chlamydospora]
MDIASQETKYLQALCPITQAPVALIIKDGRIQGGMPTHFSKEAFIQMLRAALDGQELGAEARQQMNVAQAQDGSTNALAEESNPSPTMTTPPAEEHTPASPTPQPPDVERPAQVSMAASSNTDASFPPPAAADITAPPTTMIDSQRHSYIAQQRQREAAQRAERQRIKESIEADRRERRKKAELGKKGILPNSGSADEEAGTPPPPVDIRLAVRLLSGQSIRSTFPKASTLSKTIRPWISSHLQETGSREIHTPYSFKLILAPKPNRTISISEEEMTLEELLSAEETGRGRSGVNFVLVPEKAYADAYANSYISGNEGGILDMGMRTINAGYSLATTVAGGVFGGLRSVIGGGGASSSSNTTGHPSDNTNTASSSSSGNVKIRTLADQRVEEEEDGEARKRQGRNQFYNGNQTNFVPRKKNDEEDEKQE